MKRIAIVTLVWWAYAILLAVFIQVATPAGVTYNFKSPREPVETLILLASAPMFAAIPFLFIGWVVSFLKWVTAQPVTRVEVIQPLAAPPPLAKPAARDAGHRWLGPS
jgi:hypothetical protein